MAAFEDSIISVSHDDAINYTSTIRVTITSKNNARVIASRSTDSNPWGFEGTGEIIVPIVMNTTLSIMCEGNGYDIVFSVEPATSINDYDVIANGMQFFKEYSDSLLPCLFQEAIKINDKAFARRS